MVEDVLIVAAGYAYASQYLEFNAYACQDGRGFRSGVARMGFYANGAIQIHLPLISYREDGVWFTKTEGRVPSARISCRPARRPRDLRHAPSPDRPRRRSRPGLLAHRPAGPWYDPPDHARHQ